MLGKLRKPSPKWQSFQGDSEICKLEFQPLHGWVAGSGPRYGCRTWEPSSTSCCAAGNSPGGWFHGSEEWMVLGVPICSMYGIFTCIWVIFRANVGKYSIHGAYGVPPMDWTPPYIWENSDDSDGHAGHPIWKDGKSRASSVFFSNEKDCLSIVFLLPLYASYLEVRMPRNHCLSSASWLRQRCIN